MFFWRGKEIESERRAKGFIYTGRNSRKVETRLGHGRLDIATVN
jgi:hypothetical protein